MADLRKFNEFINEAKFYRLPRNVIDDELFRVKRNFDSFYNKTSKGQDVHPKELDEIIKMLEKIRKEMKGFNHPSEIQRGSVYESK
jgi:conjugal transfer/entry exclusion protein